jgi:rRNA maturation endonuclease Nob1
MLIYAKINNIITNSNGYWVNKSRNTILKEAKVNLKGKEKKEIFHPLYIKKYIDLPVNITKTSMKVCYADLEEQAEVELTIDDFDGVIYQYLIWKGERWKRCEICGKWIKQGNTKPKKYCNICAKDIKSKQDHIRKYDKNSKCRKILKS